MSSNEPQRSRGCWRFRLLLAVIKSHVFHFHKIGNQVKALHMSEIKFPSCQPLPALPGGAEGMLLQHEVTIF